MEFNKIFNFNENIITPYIFINKHTRLQTGPIKYSNTSEQYFTTLISFNWITFAKESERKKKN